MMDMGVMNKPKESIARFVSTNIHNPLKMVFKSRKGRLIVARQFSGGKWYPVPRMRPVGMLESLPQRHLIQPSLRDVWEGAHPHPPLNWRATIGRPYRD
jgi:hypothetical protein